MTEIISLVVSVASLVVTLLSLLFMVAEYRRLDDEASEAFGVIGADEGNHEARLERLETKAGLQIIPSPSALDALLEPDDLTHVFDDAFNDEHENTELQGLGDVVREYDGESDYNDAGRLG